MMSVYAGRLSTIDLQYSGICRKTPCWGADGFYPEIRAKAVLQPAGPGCHPNRRRRHSGRLRVRTIPCCQKPSLFPSSGRVCQAPEARNGRHQHAHRASSRWPRSGLARICAKLSPRVELESLRLRGRSRSAWVHVCDSTYQSLRFTNSERLSGDPATSVGKYATRRGLSTRTGNP